MVDISSAWIQRQSSSRCGSVSSHMSSEYHIVASYRRIVSIVPLAILSSCRVGKEQGSIERLSHGERSATVGLGSM